MISNLIYYFNIISSTEVVNKDDKIVKMCEIKSIYALPFKLKTLL